MKNLFRTAAIAATFALSTSVSMADVKIGIAAEPYPPFAEKAADGNWQGWEIEFIDAVCTAMEENCEIVPVAWDGIIPALLAKKFDAIMASMSITEERMKTIDFSDRYYNTPAVIVAAKGSDISGDPASLEGKVVGVQVSTTHSNYAEAYFAETGSVKVYTGFDEHNQDLFAGRIDAVVADSLALQAFLDSDQGADFEIKGELNDVAINTAIAAIRADGTYDKFSESYFNFNIYGGE